MNVERFGSCCKDLHEAMNLPGTSLLRVEKTSVLYLTVGYVKTKEGVAWFDQAIIFCPFCGKQLQDRDEIKRRAKQ